MASIRDYAITAYGVTTSSMVMEMPEHESGDLLVACLGKDSTGTFTAPGGWSTIQAGNSTQASGGLYAKRAASSSETATFTLTLETCIGVMIAIKDVYGSTVGDAIVASNFPATDSTLPYAGGSLTTSYANALLISMRFQDTTIGTGHLAPWVNLFAGDVANGGVCAAYSFEPTASTLVSAPDMWGGGVDDGRAIMIEVRDGSSGDSIPAYIPLDVVPTVQISPLCGVTGAVDRGSYIAGTSIAITSVAGKTVTGVTYATTADSGYNPFRGSLRNAGVSSTTNLNHVELDLTDAQDITSGDLIFGTFLHLAPRDYIDSGKASQGGKYLLAGSTSGNWRAWVVGGQVTKTDSPDSRNNFLIQPSVSTTQYDSAGTPNWSSLDYLAFGSAGYYGLPAILWSNLFEVRNVILAGGSAAVPFGFDDTIFVINAGSGDIPLMQQAGALATCWAPIQFGGNEPTHVACNLNTFQYPRVADEIDYVDFHVAADKVGFEFHGMDRGSGDVDTLHFTNCLFTSPSSYYWRFDSSHDADADIDFSGTTVVGANVTLRSTVSLSNMNFIDCTAFAQNAALLDGCSFQNTKLSASAPADVDNVTNCTFSSAGTGHAIEVGGSAADFDLDNIDFSGYAGSDGSTGNEAIYVNIGSGAVTINVIGGTVPSIRTAGATVTVVVNPVTTSVHVQDIDTSAAISGARVWAVVTSGAGGWPYQESITIVNSGTTATVTHTGHGLSTNDYVYIVGASHWQNNGTFQITVTGTDTYTYTMLSAPGSNPTGTITATFVVLSGTTNGSGDISSTYSYAADQPITGRVRSASGVPYYKTAPIAGTIDSVAGLALTVQMIKDQ